MFEVNFLAVIVATIVNCILGMLWYSPRLFGTVWAKEHSFEPSSLKATPWHFISAIAVSFVTVYFFALLIHWIGIVKITEGVKLGIIVWTGFIATTHFSGVIWARKPWMVYVIDASFQLVSMIIMGAILASWQ
jgi:hypothetical protein